MAEEIDALVKVLADFTKSTQGAAEFSRQVEQASSNVQKIKSQADSLNKSLLEVAKSSRAASAVLKDIKIFSQGTLKQVTDRAGVSALLNQKRSEPDRLQLKVAQDELSLRKQLLGVGQEHIRQAGLEGLQRGKTVEAVKVQIAAEDKLRQIGKLSLEGVVAKSAELSKQFSIYTNLNNQIKQLNAAEKQRLVDAVPQKDPLARFNANNGADIFRIQTRLLVNYKLLAAAYGSVSFITNFVKELDDAFQNLQGITGVTNDNLEQLKSTVLDVAKTTKFSAVEVAQAAVILGQAGFSPDQIKESIGAITLLATATGSTLSDAVQAVTTSLNVFKLEAGQSGYVTNVLTSAVNESKLSMEQLNLALQYAGNIAADSNIPFSELVASFGVLADAGIKSGSSLGTGTRQLLNDLLAPSDKLIEKILQLGLSFDDIDVRSKGLPQVLDNLRQAGFSTADAFATLEVRAVPAFSALSKGTEKLEQFRQIALLSESAARANAAQMQSLANIGANVRNIFADLAYEALQPTLKFLKGLGQTTAEVGKFLGNFKALLQGIASSFLLIIGSGFAVWLVKLSGSLLKLGGTLGTVVEGFKLLGLAALGRVSLLATAFNPVVAAIGALVVVIYNVLSAFGLFNSASDTLADKLSKVETKIQNTEGELEKYKSQANEASKFLQDLSAKSGELKDGTEALRSTIIDAQVQFGDLGVVVFNLADSYEQLYQKVKKIRESRLDLQLAEIRTGKQDLEEKVGLLQQQAAESKPLNKVNQLLGSVNARFNRTGQLIGREQSDASQGAGVNRGFVSQQPQAEVSPELKDLFEKVGRGLDDASKSLSADGSDISKLVNQLYEGTQNKQLNPTEQAITKGLSDVLKEFRGKSNELHATNIKLQSGVEKESQTTAFSKVQEDLGQQVHSAITEITRQRQRFNDSQTVSDETNKGLPPGQGLVTPLQIREESVKLIAEQTEILKGLQKNIDSNFNKVDIAQGIEQEAINAIGGATNIQSTFTEGVAKVRQDDLKYLNELSDQKLREIEVQVHGSRGPADPALLEQFKKLFEEQTKVQLEQLRVSGDGPAAVDFAHGGFQKEEIDAKQKDKEALFFRTREQELSNRLQDFISSSANKLKDVDSRILEPTYSAFEQLQDRLKQLARTLEDVIFKIQSPVRAQQKRVDILKSPQNINSTFPELESSETEKLRVIQAEAKKKEQEAQEAALAKKKSELVTLGGQLAQAQAEADAFTKKALTTGDNEVRRDATNRAKESRGQVDKMRSSFESLEKDIQGTEQSVSKLSDEYDVLTGKVTDPSITDTFRIVRDEWIRTSGALATTSQRSAEFFRTLFDGLKSGMSDAVKSWVNGTATMGQAFKGFASSIIEDMLNIAAQQAASSLLGGLLGGLLGTAAAAPAAAGGGFGSGVGFSLFARGGIVQGGTPGRDSVPVMAMAGEGFLNKRAVDMLGEDTINALNNGQGGLSARSGAVSGDYGNRGGGSVVNVYVVDEKSMPAIGPNDVVAAVADNIARGGGLRQLIKSVVVS